MDLDLTQISTGHLRGLKERIDAGRLVDPLTAHDAAEVQALVGLALAEAGRLLAAVIAERGNQAPPPQLVWTGPGPAQAKRLDTAVTLRGLFERAEKTVVLAGYCFDHGKEILAPLHKAMDERGVQVDLFVHVKIEDHDWHKLKTSEGQDAVVRKAIDAFLTENWPGAPFPRIHYDPRPIQQALYASLHAKCVVIDGLEALVTSANFTNRGQERNVEVGALIKDPTYARSLAAQWHNALEHGMFCTLASKDIA